MKMSKLALSLVNHADRLAVDYYDGGLFDKPGWTLRLYIGDSRMLIGGGSKVIVWKTENGAYRAACKLRPDLLDTFNGIFYALD